MTIIVFFLSHFVGSSGLLAGDKGVMEMEASLISDYKAMMAADYWDRFESLAPAFKEKLKAVLSDKRTHAFPFDRIRKHITVVTSADRKLRVFSWDEKTGGTAHQMTGIAQFTTPGQSGDIRVADLENEDENGPVDDVIYYEIHDIQAGPHVYYLTFGWGTFGGGAHFKIIRAFRITDHGLTFRDSIFKYKGKICSEIILRASRMDPICLQYSAERQTIEFDELRIPESYKSVGLNIARPTGAKVRLKFDGRSFKGLRP